MSIGSGITEIEHDGADFSPLKVVEIKATTPPTLGESVFTNCSHLNRIIVPFESLEAYKTAEGWSDYATLICSYVTSKELDDYVKNNVIPSQRNYSDGKLLGFNSNGGFTYTQIYTSGIAYSNPLRDDAGCVKGNTPRQAKDLTPKDYVDNLPDNLSLTDEQKTKWKTWLESILS